MIRIHIASASSMIANTIPPTARATTTYWRIWTKAIEERPNRLMPVLPNVDGRSVQLADGVVLGLVADQDSADRVAGLGATRSKT